MANRKSTTLRTGDYSPRKLTQEVLKLVSRWPAPEGWKAIRCTETKGLVLRHRPVSGSLLLYCELGRAKQKSVAKVENILNPSHPATLQRARSDCRILLGLETDGAQVSKANQADNAKRGIPTLANFLDEYLEWLTDDPDYGRPQDTVDRLRACFVKESFATRNRMDEITQADIIRWRNRRSQKVTPETINRDVGALQALFNRYEEVTEHFENPIRGLRPLKVDREKPKRRAFNENEVAALLVALDAREQRKRAERDRYNHHRQERHHQPLLALHGLFIDYLKPAVILSLETGIRRGECFSLDWRAVDLTAFKDGKITVKGDAAKSGNTRTIPLTSKAKDALRAWWMQYGQPKAGFVFSHRSGARLESTKRSFNPLLESAGIEKHTIRGSASWHCLRHSYASRMVRRTDLETVRDLLGHSSVVTTAQYLHTDEDRKRKAVEKGAVL